MKTKPLPLLTFDADRHLYFLDDIQVPGVTGVIRQQLSPLPPVDPDLMRRAAEFGRAVHAATEYWDRGILDMESLDPALVPYLEAWKNYRAEHPGEIMANETKVCSYKYRFAGTMDRIIAHEKGPALVDIKTSTTPDVSVGPQTAAYALAAQEFLGIRIKERWCVQLTAEGYRLYRLADPSDQSAFLAALSCHNWRLKHGK